MLRVNDLFCGAGGMGLGFKQAGFRLAGAWDFDKWAVESYGQNVSPKVKQADITEMQWHDLPYADVWTFGFPCQDLSVAGKQAGMIKGKTRSGLFFEVMRLLEETEIYEPKRLPKIIMAENVKGLKKYLPVLEEEYNARGYEMYYTNPPFNSKYWGVPQNRERYFVVGVHQDLDKPFEFPEQQTDYVPKLSTVLEDEVDEKFYIADEKAKTVINQASEKGKIGQQETNVTEKIGGIWGNRQAGSCWNKNGVSPTLKTPSGGYSEPLIMDKQPVSVKNKATEFVRKSSVSHTLLARDYKGFGNQEMNAVIEGYRVRKLTPREYARLQGFPDSFEFHVSKTQLYKQFGNAVTVPVAKAIAESIRDYLNTKK